MKTRQKLDAIIAELRSHAQFDPELWRLVDHATVTLRNVDAESLIQRYRDIVVSLVWLRRPSSDIEPLDNGHYSTFWWLRMLIQTEAELARRNIENVQLPDVPAVDTLIADCVPERDTRFRVWARVSKRGYLLKTLFAGEIWFSPAEGFADAALNTAQRDDELRRHRSRPGQQIKIVGPRGQLVTPMGDVKFTRKSTTYWLSSWSTGPDLRLIDEFGEGGSGVDACIVVWEPSEFDERINAAVERDHPGWLYASFPVQYIDQYEMVRMERLGVSMTKDFSFARQRELRLGLSPTSPSAIPTGGFLVKAGSIEDIAGVYDRNGSLIAGRGPQSLIKLD